MSIALGPLGRNGEALGSLNTSGKVAAMYSYSKTRGLFGGVSIEGSVILERQDANSLAYRSDVSVKQLLSGSIEPPEWAQPLVKTLEACIGMPGGHKWIDDSTSSDGLGNSSTRDSGYVFGEGVASPGSEMPPSLRRKKGPAGSTFPPPHWGSRRGGGSYFHESEGLDDKFGDTELPNDNGISNRRDSPPVGKLIEDESTAASFPTHFESDYAPPSSSANETLARPSHHPTLSLQSKTLYTSKFTPGSPFNDLPPFPNMSKSTANGISHNHSVSSASYFHQDNKVNPNLSGASPSPFTTRSADPFAYESVGDSIDEYDRPRSTSGSTNIPHMTPKAALRSPMSPSEGVGRAIALYEFKAIEVSLLFPHPWLYSDSCFGAAWRSWFQ